MLKVLEDALGVSEEYRELPLPVRQGRSFQEWLWLTDGEKARLIQNETEQEWDE